MLVFMVVACSSCIWRLVDDFHLINVVCATVLIMALLSVISTSSFDAFGRFSGLCGCLLLRSAMELVVAGRIDVNGSNGAYGGYFDCCIRCFRAVLRIWWQLALVYCHCYYHCYLCRLRVRLGWLLLVLIAVQWVTAFESSSRLAVFLLLLALGDFVTVPLGIFDWSPDNRGACHWRQIFFLSMTVLWGVIAVDETRKIKASAVVESPCRHPLDSRKYVGSAFMVALSSCLFHALAFSCLICLSQQSFNFSAFVLARRAVPAFMAVFPSCLDFLDLAPEFFNSWAWN